MAREGTIHKVTMASMTDFPASAAEGISRPGLRHTCSLRAAVNTCPQPPGGTNCKQPDKDEVVYSLPKGYLTERRTTNGVIAVNTDGSQCHDVNSKAREHGKEPG